MYIGGKKIDIIIQTEPEQIFHGVHELVRMAFPQFNIKMGGEDAECPNRIFLQGRVEEKALCLYGSIQVDGKRTEDRQNCPLTEETAASGSKRWLARAFAYRLLCRHCGSGLNDYGLLTGVRPVKLVHRMLDRGLGQAQIMRELQQKYLITASRARLLMEVAYNNRSYLEESAAHHLVSIYIGIPLCPSRCFYCAFPGAVLKSYPEQVEPYVRALGQEMDDIGKVLKELGLGVQTIYIGGGTPTVLADKDINTLFELLHEKYISSVTREITLEAGRPDTLSSRRMELFKKVGISRLCINPQTMNDVTLKRIGRQHTSRDVGAAVEWARQAGIDRINMDLIVGLPGEDQEDYNSTIAQALELKPENITLHTLAAKKGSDLARIEGLSWQKDDPIKAGLASMQAKLRDEGYQPYYLYRQKYMRTDAENTGYSLPGCFCRFNIQMIEERQTIIGIGGGAATKLIDSRGKITSLYNPTDSDSYCTAIPALVRRKVDNLRALN